MSTSERKNEIQRYSTVQISLHWISAALVLFSLIFGTLVLKYLPNDAHKITPLFVHAIIGVIIGLVVAARLAARFIMRQPNPATTGNGLLDILRSVVHGAIYVVLFGMVASGIGLSILSGLPAVFFGHPGATVPADFWQFTPRLVHAVLAKILMVLIGLHFAATLFHHFLLKDRVFLRMWFGGPLGGR